MPHEEIVIHQIYMRRCLQLAQLGAGRVAPNPMVGSVLVYQNRIIGEGYHQQHGQVHAEVNCLASVSEQDSAYISAATLYISLEPCAHFGKTPPCADLIIRHKIKKVLIGCADSFDAVNGKGIAKLQQAGIAVVVGILENECKKLNNRFFTFHQQKRPYVLLKWAQTLNCKIGSLGNERLHISNAFTNRLVHRWRSEEAAILVGTRTALQDNPALNVRLWEGKQPVRLVIDKQLSLPNHFHLFNGQQPTVVFNFLKNETKSNLRYWQLETNSPLLPQLLQACWQMNIQSILVEGGAKLLQSFINEGLWDQARIITNQSLVVNEGVAAPVLSCAKMITSEHLENDRIDYFERIQV